jgi:NADPH:quinone reductase-like Zn-dependent oxidoreductase/NADP-dependent 3-hydroxy acid dehydrogenase YdfG
MTDGWWRFTDRDLRPDYPLLGAAAWLALLEREGFSGCTTAPAARGVFSWQSVVLAAAPAAQAASGDWLVLPDRGDIARLLCDRLAQQGHRCQLLAPGAARPALRTAIAQLLASGQCRGILHFGAVDTPAADAPAETLALYERETCGSILDLVQELVAQRPVPLTLLTRGAKPVAPGPLAGAPAATVWGVGQAIALEHPELQCRCIDLDPASDSTDALLAELLAGSRENQVGLRAGLRHVARLVRAPLPASPPPVYRLESHERGVFDRLHLAASSRRSPGAGEVEIAVTATALNFADVMDALGVRPGGAYLFGGECAGEIVAVGAGVTALAVGDEVMAIADGCYASHVTCRAELVLKKPAAFSAAEAAALPIASITARFALQEVAQLRAGERVLIHSAAGGVGVMAVQLALRLGAEVFATAGSAEKRAYLAALGVTHVMDSRTRDFAREVRERTGGAGVQVVLNSLAGDFIAASVECLAHQGRFIEIGKTGWSSERFHGVRGDAAYHLIDWWPMTRSAPATVRHLLEQAVAEIAQGTLALPPLTAFDATDAPRAFKYMAQGAHIGKVVMRHARPAVIHDQATYLITGGLGGLGLLVAARLAARGARSLVLLGRRAPAAGWAADTLAQIEQGGTRVTIVQADVSRPADMAALFRDVLPKLPPLKGVVHSAGLLDDGVLQMQSRERFDTVLAPKVTGTALLDQLTHAMPLDFFVAFSSVASVLGSPGQANHSAANAGMDSLMHSRRTRGLAGCSINWGAWSGVGAAVRHDVGQRIAQQGVGMIDVEGGLAAFEAVLAAGVRQAVVVPMDWARYGAQFATRQPPPLLADLLVKRKTAAPTATAVEPASLQRQLEQTPEDGRPRVVLDFVRTQALRILGLPAAHPLGVRQPLNELGLDSLMAVELRNSLASSLGRQMPATLLFDYPTVEALSRYLQDELLGRQVVTAPQPEVSVERIAQMSEDEVERQLAARMAKGRKP